VIVVKCPNQGCKQSQHGNNQAAVVGFVHGVGFLRLCRLLLYAPEVSLGVMTVTDMTEVNVTHVTEAWASRKGASGVAKLKTFDKFSCPCHFKGLDLP
jgi:hypothetical protein